MKDWIEKGREKWRKKERPQFEKELQKLKRRKLKFLGKISKIDERMREINDIIKTNELEQEYKDYFRCDNIYCEVLVLPEQVQKSNWKNRRVLCHVYESEKNRSRIRMH